MELFTYYTLIETLDEEEVLNMLYKFKKEGKIEYELEGDIIKFIFVDLMTTEMEELLDVFDKNDVMPYLEKEDNEDDDGLNLEDYFDF